MAYSPCGRIGHCARAVKVCLEMRAVKLLTQTKKGFI